VVTGGSTGALLLLAHPKLPGLPPPSTMTLQPIVVAFQEFMDGLLPVAIDDTAAAFNCTAGTKE
jgi:hypothetical protein